MSTYEPGTVAVATVRGIEGVRVMRVVGNYSSAQWASADGDGPCLHEPKDVTDVRPLVVLDLDEADFHWAVKVLREPGIQAIGTRIRIADQIAAQIKPKIEEPKGWGAVVEDDTGHYWTLYAPEAGAWINYSEGKCLWSGLTPVRVVSEGVTE